MSDDATPQVPADDFHGTPLPSDGDYDLALKTLVRVFSGPGGSSISVTLSVNGAFITGDLVSRDHWWETWPEQGTVSGEKVQQVLTTFRDSVVEAMAEAESTGDNDYVFLVRAVPLDLAVAGSSNGAHWRVPLARVDGWSLGTINQRK